VLSLCVLTRNALQDLASLPIKLIKTNLLSFDEVAISIPLLSENAFFGK